MPIDKGISILHNAIFSVEQIDAEQDALKIRLGGVADGLDDEMKCPIGIGMGENADRCIAVETVVRWLLNGAHINKFTVGEHMKMHLLHFLLFAAVGNQHKTIAILGKCAG